MTDLDEREDSFDALMRAAGGRLRDHVTRSAMPEFRSPRRSHRRRWVIVMATAAVVIVGLVAIGTNRNDQSLGNHPARLRWLVKDLPQGFKAVAAVDPGGLRTGFGPSLVNLYATRDAPNGPILSVQGSQDQDPSLHLGLGYGMTNFSESTIAGRRAVFADTTGGRVLYVEIDNHWVLLTSRRIDDSQLSAFAQVAVLSADGTAAIPAAALPDGLELVAPASAPMDGAIFGSGGSGVAASSYVGPGGMTLAVEVRRPAVLAWFGLSFDLRPVKIGDTSGFVGSYNFDSAPPIVERLVYWEHNDVAFILRGNGVSEAEILTAATSVVPASSSEWAALLQSGPGVASAETVLATSPAGVGAPPGTDPPFTGAPRDVALDVSVSDVSANEQLWSGTLATGELWEARVVRLYDTISITTKLNGNSQSATSGLVARPPGEEIGCCGPVHVVTANVKASALRVVRHNGERYTIPLRDLPGTDGLRIALIALPDSGPAQAELIDSDGNVIEKSPVGR